MSWIAVGITGVSAAVKLGEGISQNSKASAIEKANPYPTEAVDQGYYQNVNQAQSMANQGIAAPAYNNQLNSINQNQAGTVQALGKSANPGANLASIVRQGDQAANNLNSQDAVARNRNMLQLLQERQTLAQQKDKAWDWNYQQKYLGNLAKSQALRGSANANINSGANDIGSGALTAGKLGAFGSTGGSTGGNTTGGYFDSTPETNAGESTTS